MLLSAFLSVVFLRRFVQLKVSVRGKGNATLTDCPHFLGYHRLETSRDPKVLGGAAEALHSFGVEPPNKTAGLRFSGHSRTHVRIWSLGVKTSG